MKSATLLPALLPALASATTHHLLVGTFSGAHLYAVAFDDQTHALSLAANLTAHAAHAWIALSHDKSVLYGVEDGGWTSYSIDSATAVTHTATLPLTGANCSNDRSIFVVAAREPPYNVYGDPFGDCANVLSVDEAGALEAVAQNVTYTAGTSGVHGMALSVDGRFVYAADDSGNAVWTHSVDEATGLLTEVSRLEAPSEGANPRHAAVHPKGGYLYVVLEEANKLAQYKLDTETGLPVFENVTYPLIPESELATNVANYWSDDVAVAASGDFLWASARSRDETKPGYISGYTLSSTGAILKQVFLTNTTTSGGSANAVTPAPFGNEFVALTDTQEEFLQVWKRDANGSIAEVVARLDLQDGGCCANAVWLD
ncbi:carboxy-muconate cyclase [Diplodia corticola]|uniref:Carboxy-muconate cyclase n=1 Tax=Diplodia corticola TaxID=236234 RepID=A0A1J9RMS9_9PEZI|nr:carboxy-muconate cyclase [Diplodia corticola]OJD28909.1 carboxy-muconate cyclase [Diplodia corticola]